MELSEEDISRLEALGHRRDAFSSVGDDGVPRLRNQDGRCVFLGEGSDCLVYDSRPLGCEIYPVNCDDRGNVLVDDFCQAADTLEKREVGKKGVRLRRHLRTIDEEARCRKG
jgi:Fe-S-cluster containining protein